MSVRNVAKADVVLKDFWKDNARFADLFNAVLFDGEQKLQQQKMSSCPSSKRRIVCIR